MEEIPALYDVARKVCHDAGLPWTDPRTGITYPPPPKAIRTDTTYHLAYWVLSPSGRARWRRGVTRPTLEEARAALVTAKPAVIAHRITSTTTTTYLIEEEGDTE